RTAPQAEMRREVEARAAPNSWPGLTAGTASRLPDSRPSRPLARTLLLVQDDATAATTLLLGTSRDSACDPESDDSLAVATATLPSSGRGTSPPGTRVPALRGTVGRRSGLLWTNADDGLPGVPLGRVEGGGSIVEGRDVADVGP